MIRTLFAATALLLAPSLGGANAQELATATFAGGCFWCVESDFDSIPGVVKTVLGYTGGISPNPITYDPSRVAYADLLTAFWHSVDPTDPGGQFCDRGESYQTAIFANSDEQRQLAELSRIAVEASLGQPIVTPIEAAGPFFPPRRITRITTRRTRYGTASIAGIAGVTSVSRRSGASMPIAVSPTTVDG